MYDDASRTAILPANGALIANQLTVKFDHVYSGALLMRYSVILTSTNEVIQVSEKQIWFNVVDACTVIPTITSQTITPIVYNIHPTNNAQRTLTPFTSTATTSYGGQNGNPATLCGPISYALYEFDKATLASQPYLSQTVDASSNVLITVQTNDPQYYTGGVGV